MTERDGQIARLIQVVNERDGQIINLNQSINEREGQITSLNQALAEIESSMAWKLVTVIRKIRLWLIPKDSHREGLAKKVWRGIKNGKS